jgi:hypothetical protein
MSEVSKKRYYPPMQDRPVQSEEKYLASRARVSLMEQKARKHAPETRTNYESEKA